MSPPTSTIVTVGVRVQSCQFDQLAGEALGATAGSSRTVGVEFGGEPGKRGAGGGADLGLGGDAVVVFADAFKAGERGRVAGPGAGR